MPTHVYANGREIACQAADGIASPAFPDPCWTPPPPPAGPVVIPYANTARPKTLKKGSRKVFIGGKPVALGDRSYFSTSIGDEPATHGLAKGVISGVIKGKAYFRSWSMNVIIEGHGVARHLDRMTHNHGGALGNTPPAPYISRPAPPEPPCGKDDKRIEDTCGSKTELTDENCMGLRDLPRTPIDKENYATDLEKICGNIAENPKALDRAHSVLTDMLAHASMTTAPDIKEIRNLFLNIENDLKKFKKLNPEDKQKLIQTLTPDNSGRRAALNAALASLNDCLVARKCGLVPYAKEGKNGEKPSTNGGCCPGQTGHHLI